MWRRSDRLSCGCSVPGPIRASVGDIDLYLEIDADVPNALHLVRTLPLAAFARIGERRIDIVVRAQDTPPSALHDLAKLEGVLQRFFFHSRRRGVDLVGHWRQFFGRAGA